MEKRVITTCVSLIAFLFVGTSKMAAQTWTFQGTQICYNLGSTVQCYARGTISSFVNERERAFDAGRTAGQGAGALVGVLIAAWLNHRQQVKIETEELTKELQSYFDAEFELIQYEQVMESEDQQSITELEPLDSTRKAGWELQLDSSKKLYDQRAKYLSDLKGLLNMEMKEKRRKALRYFIDHEPDGAKARFGRQRTMAARGYVVNEFLKALVGSYRQQPPTPEEERSVTKVRKQKTQLYAAVSPAPSLSTCSSAFGTLLVISPQLMHTRSLSCVHCTGEA